MHSPPRLWWLEGKKNKYAPSWINNCLDWDFRPSPRFDGKERNYIFKTADEKNELKSHVLFHRFCWSGRGEQSYYTFFFVCVSTVLPPSFFTSGLLFAWSLKGLFLFCLSTHRQKDTFVRAHGQTYWRNGWADVSTYVRVLVTSSEVTKRQEIELYSVSTEEQKIHNANRKKKKKETKYRERSAQEWGRRYCNAKERIRRREKTKCCSLLGRSRGFLF